MPKKPSGAPLPKSKAKSDSKTTTKSSSTSSAPDVEISGPVADKKGWKYYCNDEQVTEAVYKQMMEDHSNWVKEQEKAAVDKQAEEAKLDRKGNKNVKSTKARKR